MITIIAWAIKVVLFLVLLALPLLLFFWTKRYKVIDTTPGNRDKGHDLLVLEYYMVELINGMKEQVGKAKVEHKPVLSDFGSAEWEMVRVQCRQSALGSIRKLAWIKEVMS